MNAHLHKSRSKHSVTDELWVWLQVPFFALLKVLGLLRVLPEQEHEGLDISHHGGSAYPKEMIRAGSWGSHRDGGANLR